MLVATVYVSYTGYHRLLFKYISKGISVKKKKEKLKKKTNLKNHDSTENVTDSLGASLETSFKEEK